MIKLRKMTMEDADLLLSWKNYPETREFAIVSHEIIERENHLKWLEKNIQYFQIIEETGVECGAIRIQDNEISIWIDRELWGLGYAQDAINLASQKGYTAKIVAGNIASMRCFIKCGYLPISFQDGYFIFQK